MYELKIVKMEPSKMNRIYVNISYTNALFSIFPTISNHKN